MKLSEDQIKAAAQTALAARNEANAAKAKATESGGVDPELNKARDEAEAKATEAESLEADLSQKYTTQQKDISKMKAKKADIDRTLRDLGVDDADDEDEEDEDDLDDPKRPLTVGDLQRIKARESAKTATQLADAVGDTAEAQAIKDALKTDINPALIASNPQKAFENARAIVNREKNSKIVEEHNRKKPAQIRSNGAGAPPKVDEEFIPTAEEERYMRGPLALTKEEILSARR